ncbi:MAG: chloride channel protein [Bacteroidota bacterium]|nr:chloride channel protein [Bacteroidota bacterium]
MKGRRLVRLRQKVKFLFDLIGTERIRSNALQAFPFWVASLLVGLVAVAYTKLFGYSEELLKEVLAWHSWAIFIIAPVCFFLAWLIVQLLAPTARGSGIPQVMAAIDLTTPKHDHKVKKLLSFRIAVTKIGSSLLMVLGGGAIGREGPTIQIAGSVFRMVNKWIPASWPKLSKQSFILTGAAAGLAAAFNTPLGGVVFAMEELAKIHVRHFRTALFSAVIIAGLTAQGFLGPYLYLGYPNVQGLQFKILLAVAATAILTGVLGSLMCKAILRVMKWKRRFSKTKTILFVIGAGVVVSFLAYFLNDEVLGSGKDLMNKTLFTDRKGVSWHTVLMRIIGPVIAFNTGAAGGVFAPALSAGASVGAFLSNFFDVGGANANILILSGMVGFLTGVTRTPFTSAILVLEMTDRHSVIFHLMLAALVSNIAALVIDKHSFYEQLKHGYLEEALNDNNPAIEDIPPN